MKITQQAEKPNYVPITITLQTPYEYFSLVAAIGLRSIREEGKWIASQGVMSEEEYQKNVNNEVFCELHSMFDKVKETL